MDKEQLLNLIPVAELYGMPPADDMASYSEHREAINHSDFWIISHWPHREHVWLPAAKREKERLAAAFPHQAFRIYHCKRRLSAGHSRENMLALCNVIDELLAPPNQGKPFKERIEKARALVDHVRPKNK